MAGVLGFVSSAYGPVMELWKCVAAPIRRQLNYLCCFDSNINDLREEAKKLDDVREGLQMRVKSATDNAEEIFPQVETWLKKAIDMKNDVVRRIEEEVLRVHGGGHGHCLPIKERYSLSKRAKEATEAMAEHREQGKFDYSNISQPARPIGVVEPGTSTIEFRSRKGIEEEIMKALKDENTNTIGICGMGGVGKTTMAERMMKKASEEHLFDYCVKVPVSHEVDFFTIQLVIAETLHLSLDEKTLQGRANKLRARLSGASRVLITLDDVWEKLALEDLGIPCKSGVKGCKVMITSRNKDVLFDMNVQKIKELYILCGEEPWFLFSTEAGLNEQDSELCSIAEQVMKECKGLPLALKIVASALKDVNTLPEWRDALQQLRRSDPGTIPKFIQEVYNPLKFSYDFLRIDLAKSLMLLCCLFLEDRYIPIDDLTYFAMGLKMFEGVESVAQARDRTHTLVRILKHRFLLLNGEHDDHDVLMHDVVRDVAIYIATKEGKINCNECEWSSSFLNGRANSHMETGLPSLRLLWIDFSYNDEFQFNNTFIEETTSLYVLVVSFGPFRSLPNATRSLHNLRTLTLYKCNNLETITGVGELVNLEIFRCYKCPSIEEVPSEMGNLIHLRLLELSKCESLETVAAGVISKLVRLEELNMKKSFNKWEAENQGKEGKNAKLSELGSLSKLTRLEIEVEDSSVAMQPISLGTKVDKYDITIGKRPTHGRSSKRRDTRITLCLERGITDLGNWIHNRVPSVKFLYLTGDGSGNLDLAQAQKLESLTLKHCRIIQKLVSITTTLPSDHHPKTVVFPHLEYLRLKDLPKLEETHHFDGPVPKGSVDENSFKKLKELRLEDLPLLRHFWKSSYNSLSSIYIEKCDSLRSLAPLSTCRSQLETLDISDCLTIEEIFLWDDVEKESGRSVKEFPKLKKLNLSHLPNVAAFCKGIERIEFPVLTYMSILGCPKLKSLVDYDGSDSSEHHSSHLLCTSKVSFSILNELYVKGCDKTLSLWCQKLGSDSFTRIAKLQIEKRGSFPSSIAQSLVNLQQLKVRNCREMIKVIEDEDENEEKRCLLPALRKLEMRNLPKLQIFCKQRRSTALELPLLDSVIIQDCPLMKVFSSGFLSTPKLTTLKIDDSFIVSNDINAALQQH